MIAPRVKPIYRPPGLLVRQGLSALYYSRISGWSGLGAWIGRLSRTLPMAAGAVGMGCIGFPNHPVWEVTTACNLRCQHCHASSGEPMEGELDTARALELAGEVARVGEFRMMVFTGGEPLVRPDILDLIARCQLHGFISVVATNAVLIDAPLASQLKRLGVAGVAVSLDGPEPGLHDNIRGVPGAFQRALAGIEAAREAGLSVQINITAMRENLQEIPRILRYADDLGSDIVLLYQLIPVGRGDQIRDQALTAQENRELMDTIIRVQPHLRTIVQPVAAPQFWPHLLGSSKDPGFLDRLSFHGCVAGRGLAYIKPHGEIWACPFLPLSAGSVEDSSFEEIWRDSQLFRDLRTAPLGGECGRCPRMEICRGCRSRAYALKGDYLAEDPSCFMSPVQPYRD